MVTDNDNVMNYNLDIENIVTLIKGNSTYNILTGPLFQQSGHKRNVRPKKKTSRQ